MVLSRLLPDPGLARPAIEIAADLLGIKLHAVVRASEAAIGAVIVQAVLGAIGRSESPGETGATVMIAMFVPAVAMIVHAVMGEAARMAEA